MARGNRRRKQEPPRAKKKVRPSHIRVRKVRVVPAIVARAPFVVEEVLVLYDIENLCVKAGVLARTLGWQMRAFLEEHGYLGSVRIHAIAGSKSRLPNALIPLLKEGQIKFRYSPSKKSQAGDKNLKALLRRTLIDDRRFKRCPGTIVMISSDVGYEINLKKARNQGYNVIIVYDPDRLDPLTSTYLATGNSICHFDDFISRH